jgi:ATP-binding cassette, subfamily B, multidrug efflux pump
VIRLLRTYLRPYGWKIAAVLVLLLLQSIGSLYLPTLQGDIINNGVAKGDTDYIGRIGIDMLLFTLAVGAASILGVFWGAQVAMGFGRDVRGALFRQVERFSQVEVNRFGTPSLITRNTNDVQQVQMLVFMGLTLILSAPILIIGGIILALRQDVPLSGLLLVALPLMALFIGIVMSRALPLFRSMQVKVDRINQVMRETLAGVRVIRAFVRTKHEERRFDEANVDLFDTSLRVQRLFAATIPVMTLILNVSTVGVMWFGAIRVDSGDLPIGNLTAFLQYLLQIMFAMLMAVFMFVFVPRAAVSAGRIQEVLETEPSIRDPEQPIRLPSLIRAEGEPSGRDGRDGHDGHDGHDGRDAAQLPGVGGRIEFRNLEFRYPGAQDPVLHDVSFVVNPGETVAIVGSTGSGKSTLINLIPRFYDATGGSVLVDGADVREITRADLWGRLGVVPQKAFLFSGTVASNLRFGDEHATDEQLWAALGTAQARDFVEEMDGKLEAPITQGGTNVSGGQRQRLAIARALVKRAGVLIFDDSFSALDFGTDARLRAALERDLGWATRLIVAQRVGTIMKADRILVMDAGRIVGSGTHAELLASNETYQEIVYSQLSEAEAAA